MNATIEQIQHAIIVWYRDNADQHLSSDREQLVKRCAAMLVERFEVSLRTAERDAWVTLSELVVENDWRINFNNSTTHCLFLQCGRTGETKVLLTGDLTGTDPLSWPVAGTTQH